MKRNQYKQERQQFLEKKLQESPFLSDEELAESLSVSIPTVRLDRLELGIPELRVRTKEIAERFYSQIRSHGHRRTDRRHAGDGDRQKGHLGP